jgi:hypothetical protein
MCGFSEMGTQYRRAPAAYGGSRIIRQMDQHKTDAPDVTRMRQAHREYKSHGNCHIDGVVVLLEDSDAHV